MALVRTRVSKKGNVTGLEFDLVGEEKVLAALKALPDRVQKKVLRKVIRAAMKKVLKRAQDNMPVDTGVARDALKVVVSKRQKRGSILLSVEYDTEKVLGNAPDYPKDPRGKFFYPAVIEYGSRTLKRLPVAPLRRAYEGTAEEAKEYALNAIVRETRREAAKLNTGG